MQDLGKRIGALRRSQDLTLEELGKRTGFSASFLSQAERGLCSISLTSLDRIASELGVTLGHFFPQEKRNRYFTREGDRQKIRVENSLLLYEVLSGDFQGRGLEAMLITILPGKIQDGMYRHDGEEVGFVLQGTLHMTIEEEEFELGPGTSIHFPSTELHMWQNRTNEPALVLWVNTKRLT